MSEQPHYVNQDINLSQDSKNLPKKVVSNTGEIVGAESLLMLAAAVGLFPTNQLIYPLDLSVVHFQKADYRIRQTQLSDLPALMQLEQECWAIELQATSANLLDRLNNYPQGQLVMELPDGDNNYQVVGAIYSQRIESVEILHQIVANRVSELHSQTGSVVQLLAVNILPDFQERRLGDRLLEFMLQWCSAIDGIESVVAVTLCQDFHRYEFSLAEYIGQRNVQGRLIDPILRFHELHGAEIECIVENYRPLDRNNQGHGVLVRYPIHQRRRDEDRGINNAQELNPRPGAAAQVWDHDAAAAFLAATVQSRLDDEQRSGYKFDRPLMEMGLNSVDLLILSEQISDRFGLNLDPAFFFRYPTPAKVLMFLSEHHSLSVTQHQNFPASTVAPTHTWSETTPKSARSGDAVAIIGLACRLPGGINNPDDLWDLLKNGGSAIEELPQERWQWPGEIDPKGKHQGIDRGGFLSQIDLFDAGFFRISAIEAQSMDPQQRILLELAWQTLENAGVTATKVTGSNTGVFVGASGSDYCRVIERLGIPIEAHAGTGTSLAALANRISYFFDLRGPSIVLDTACSSSLIAVHQAVRSIRSGECVQALVGGVHIMSHPANSIAYYKAGMLAHDGKCKTFDDRADGYVRSEGAVMFLLKQLSQAEADGDLIYATIGGSAANHGGQSAGLTVPNPAQQAALLTDAWKDAGIDPHTISFIEAHGTGTALGDPIEIQGIQTAFSQWSETPQVPIACGVGSLKTNLGHLEAAAGIAGLLKVVLCLQHQELPATGHFAHLNRHIELLGSPLYIVAQHQQWDRPHRSIPRRAGVSSFGSGGANAHVMVEEYDLGCKVEDLDRPSPEPFLFVLSAQNIEQLRNYVQHFEQWLSSLSDDRCSMAELTRFLQCHRHAFEERLAVVATSRVDLVNKLRLFPDLGAAGFQGNIKHSSREIKTLMRGDLGKQIIQTAIAGRDWEQLAALWVAGVALDWSLLEGNQLPTASSKYWRLSIPTYPFARHRFWLSDPISLPKSTHLIPVQRKQIDVSGAIKLEPAARQSADEATLFTLKLVWQQLETAKSEKSSSKMPDGKTAIFGCIPEQQQVWQSYFSPCEFISIATNTDIQDLVEQLRGLGAIAHIVWVGTTNLDRHDFPDRVLVDRDSDLLQVYRLLKAAAVIYGSERLQWTLIALQSQAVFDGEDPDPIQASIHGFIGSVAKEFPHWRFRLLDLPSPAEVASRRLLDEIRDLPFNPEVRSLAWRDGKWYRPILAQILLEEPARSAYRAGGVYVVIGGAGGLGEVWSQYLSEKYQAQIVWIGRSPLNDTIGQKMEAIASRGPMPRYISADATSQQELQQAYAQIKSEFGRVQGVVHGAVGVFDRSFNDMDETEFRAVLAAKVDVSVRLAQVFHAEDLDFVLFFSSIEALSQSGGLSGYAAGCAFKDAFAQYLTHRWHCPVKVIHWGHWAIGTGERISAAAKTRLKQRGIGLLESTESMQALECLVSNDRLNQLAVIKSVSIEAIDWYDGEEFVVSYKEVAPSVSHEIHGIDVASNQSIETLEADSIFQSAQMQPLLLNLLRNSLNNINPELSGNRPEFYTKWLAASRSILNQNPVTTGLEASINGVWQDWHAVKKNLGANDSKQRAFSLVESCIQALPEILSGQKRSTDTLFPNGSLQIVEGIYRDNPVADYFNEVLAKSLRTAIETRLKHDPQGKFRILEIGAGTGATTKAILSQLAGLEDRIGEYCYTDISRAFLLHAQEHLIPNYPFVRVGIFDVEQPLAGQSIEADAYDFAIATNVLHATRNIRQTLRNVKACLRSNGLILLNELCEQTLFGHLTFGLLEGWWRHEDPELRIDGTPLLSVASWARVLQTEGFKSPWFPVENARSLGQQVILAESDGLVRQKHTSGDRKAPPLGLNTSDRQVTTSRTEDDDRVSLRPSAIPLFQGLIAKILRMNPEQIEVDEPFQSYGIDSILIVQITGALQEKFGEIHSTLLFEVQTLGELVDYFIEHRPSDLIAQIDLPQSSITITEPEPTIRAQDNEPTTTNAVPAPAQLAVPTRSHPPEGIAIIGMSGRYPMAQDLPTFWAHLKAGTDCISEIPRDRWSWEDYFHPHMEEAIDLGKSYCKWGSFLDDAKEFDAQFFGISPHEVVNIDPQERIFLQAAWAALEDAGHTKQMLESQYQQQVGVFVGVTRTGFDLYGPELWRQGKIAHPHTSFSSIANRLSYFLNLRGPSMPIDTMCSSSLTAVHEACQHLQNGSVRLAIAGGVNLYLHPSSYNILCANRMLSQDGRCKSFGNHSNGFVPGEGVGVVVLKPLSQAIADRDNIYAVIRSTHVNHGGKTNGYTVPNPKAQAELVFDALLKSGVDARAVSYIEAHGTGTELGDPIEVAGLTNAFARYTQDTNFCALGSVKSNLGHLEAASGIAGLTKAILQLRHKQLVPSLHAEELNPKIDFDRTPFYVQRRLEHWQQPIIELDGKMKTVPRIAGVSSFGAGGVNAHVVVEEYDMEESEVVDAPVLVVLSARNNQRLVAYARKLHQFLAAGAVNLQNLAYTLQVGREALPSRMATIVSSPAEAIAKLDAFIQGKSPLDDCYVGMVGQDKATANQWNADPNLVKQLTTWTEEGCYDRLAELWVKGVNIDWSKLHRPSNICPRRISLPTYPFDPKRYWFELEENKSSETTPTVNTQAVSDERITQPIPGENRQQKTRKLITLTDPDKVQRDRVNLSDRQPIRLSDRSALTLPTKVTSSWLKLTPQGQGIVKIEVNAADLPLEASKPIAELKERMRSLALSDEVRVWLLVDDNGLFSNSIIHDQVPVMAALMGFLLELELPLIGVLKSDLRGAGWNLASLCDFLIFRASGQFCYRGLTDSPKATLHERDRSIVEERFGKSFAQRFLTGTDLCSGQILAAMGLDCPIASDEQIDALARDLAERISQSPQRSLVELKKQLSRSVHSLARHAYFPSLANPQSKLTKLSAIPEFFSYQQLNRAVAENDRSLSPPTFVATYSDVIHVHAFTNGVVQLTLADINHKNMFSTAFSAGLTQAFEHIKNGADYRVVVLVGYDKYFACGGTKSGLQDIYAGRARFTDNDIHTLPLRCHLPVIAAMQGHAIGGGWSLGMFCDLTIFSAESIYQAPYMQYGFTPGAGSTLIFPTRLGANLSREILFGGREYQGAELKRRGIEMPVLPRNQVLNYALKLADHLAQLPKDDVLQRKAQTTERLRDLLDTFHAQEVAMHEQTFVGQSQVLKNIHERFDREFNGPLDLQPHPQAVLDRNLHLLQTLKETIAAELLMEPAEIDEDTKFVDMGLDSISAVMWIRRINAKFGLSLAATKVYSYPTVREFANYLEGLNGQTVTPETILSGDRVEDSTPTPVTANGESPSSPSVLKLLRESLAEELFMAANEIDSEAKFVDMGMDSITAVTWIRKINKLFGSSLPATDVYKYPTLSDFAHNLDRTIPSIQPNTPAMVVPPPTVKPPLVMPSPPPHIDLTKPDEEATPTAPVNLFIGGTNTNQNQDAIAVIGMAGRFPQAKNLTEFWENIAKGKSCISEIASDRWNLADFYDPDRNAPNKTYCKWMGALEEIDRFDPLFFHISPREAEFMDPQQRLFLQASWQCIEDAGYNPMSLAGSKCGVFVGCEPGEYGKIVQRSELNALGLLGGSAALLPARIAYFLDLQGPCMAIDTACSASLVAIANACDSLILGNSNIALAGGVYILCGPEMHVMMSKAGILSPQGRCFTFDRRADGFVPGEGVGVLLLKRLADAERDGDDIYGVIRGWGVNQDGKTNGITAPNGQSQQRLQQAVYERFGIQPADIQLIEAHGTGTALGDPIEVEALCETFGKFTDRQKFCALGSVKSNIGHLATAAGVAGVIKVMLAIGNKKLPPTIEYESLNEHINLDRSPFYINTECLDWNVGDGEPRRAAINCFGFSGTNAHMVIEEYIDRPHQRQAIGTDVTPDRAYPILLSARNEERLTAAAQQLLEHLESQTLNQQPATLRYRLCDLAYTLQVGREAMDARLAFVADTWTEVIQKLRRFIDRSSTTLSKSGNGIYYGLVGDDRSHPIEFVNDRDVLAMANSWLSQGKYSQVLELWVQGGSIDWRQIYRPDLPQPQRIHLPTYPFARESYWIGSPMGASEDLSDQTSECVAADRLEWTLETLPDDISWSDRFTDYQGKNIVILSAHDRDRDGICSLLRQIEVSVGLERPLYLQCVNFNALDTIAIEQPVAVVLAIAAQDDPLGNSFALLGKWLKSHSGGFNTYYLTLDPPDGGEISNPDRNCRIIRLQPGTSSTQQYQILLREWLSHNPFNQQPREWGQVRYDGDKRFVIHPIKSQPIGSGEQPQQFYSIQKKWKQQPIRQTEIGSTQGEILILVNAETADLGQHLFSNRQAVIVGCINHDRDRYPRISGKILNFGNVSSGLAGAETILSKLKHLRLLVDLTDIYQSPKERDRAPLGKIAFYQRLVSVSTDLDILYITQGLQHFRSETISLAGSKLAGLIKVLSAEHAYVRSRHIDIDPGMFRSPELLEQLLTQELTAQLEETEICYRHQQRFVPYLEAELASPSTDVSIRSNGVYVISGGTGGIGLEIADLLVSQGAKKLVLMGLNPLPPKSTWGDDRQQFAGDLKLKLDKLARLDRQVEHLSIYTGALTEERQLADFFAEIRERVGPIVGVIHSAGIGSDFQQPAFITKDLDRIAAVLEPKVAGLETLATIFRHDTIDFFVAFSSLTGLIPRFGKGSCDYALANTYVDWFMAYQNAVRHKQGYKSITWVDWHETGMAARSPACIFKAMQHNLDRVGLVTHPNQVGKALFKLALGQRETAWVLNTELDLTKFGEAAPTLLYVRDRVEDRVSQGVKIPPTPAQGEPLLVLPSGDGTQTKNSTNIGCTGAALPLAIPSDEVASIQHQIEQWESQVQHQGFIAPECITKAIDWAEINSLDPQSIERIYRLLFPDRTGTIGDNDNQAANPIHDSPAKPQDEPAIDVIRQAIIQVLKLKSIDDNRKFQDYGLDSISATQLAIKLEHQLKREILPKWLIDYPTITLLAQYLIGDNV